MIALDWGTIRNPGFQQALGKLLTKDLEWKTGYWLKRIKKKVESEAKEAHEEFVKLVKKHADIDEKGNFNVREDAKEAWHTDLAAFEKTQFEIPFGKIKAEELGRGMSALDMEALEPLLDFTSFEEGPETPAPLKAVEPQKEASH